MSILFERLSLKCENTIKSIFLLFQDILSYVFDGFAVLRRRDGVVFDVSCLLGNAGDFSFVDVRVKTSFCLSPDTPNTEPVYNRAKQTKILV